MEESKVSFADKEKVEGRLYSYLRFETINIRITCTEGFPWTRMGFTGHLSANTSAEKLVSTFLFQENRQFLQKHRIHRLSCEQSRFRQSEIESMSSKQLSRFAYAINQYRSGNSRKAESWQGVNNKYNAVLAFTWIAKKAKKGRST